MAKFVDSLPGLSADGGVTGANNLGQYIPIAVKDTTTYPGSDYYQLGITDYTKQMHSDLFKPTKLRGYVDLGTGSAAISGTPDRGRARPAGAGQDHQPTGRGRGGQSPPPGGHHPFGGWGGPLGPGAGYYTQNRTAIHLHGGFTPWISDGTPHQWFTPAGERASTRRA